MKKSILILLLLLPLLVTTIEAQEEDHMIQVPIFGEVCTKEISMPIFTSCIAFIDGLNPCTIWVLSFLIALLLHVHSKKRILFIGLIFISVVFLIYYLFMVAWLNIFLFIGYIGIMRVIIALMAIAAGLINLKDVIWLKKGISLTIPDKLKPKLYKKMRDLLNKKSLWTITLATIILAAFSSLIELPCTSGFPAIYTKILTMQGMTGIQYYLTIAGYCLIYIIPLAIVITVLAFAKGKKMSEKWIKILKLIGGLIMLGLGLVLLFNPGLLSFG